MKRTPSSSPASRTGITLGWSIEAASFDSRRKRSRKRSSSECSGRMSLSATGRWSASSSARYTTPMSPWPITSSTRHPAKTEPGGSWTPTTSGSGARGGGGGTGGRAGCGVGGRAGGRGGARRRRGAAGGGRLRAEAAEPGRLPHPGQLHARLADPHHVAQGERPRGIDALRRSRRSRSPIPGPRWSAGRPRRGPRGHVAGRARDRRPAGPLRSPRARSRTRLAAQDGGPGPRRRSPPAPPRPERRRPGPPRRG